MASIFEMRATSSLEHLRTYGNNSSKYIFDKILASYASKSNVRCQKFTSVFMNYWQMSFIKIDSFVQYYETACIQQWEQLIANGSLKQLCIQCWDNVDINNKIMIANGSLKHL